MIKKRFIRLTGVFIAFTVLLLSLLVSVAARMGWFSEGGLFSPDDLGYHPNQWDRPPIELDTSIQIEQMTLDTIGKIDGLPALGDLKLSDQFLLEEIRGMFDSLSYEQQGLVTNYDKLVAAEERMEELKEEVSMEGIDSELESIPDDPREEDTNADIDTETGSDTDIETESDTDMEITPPPSDNGTLGGNDDVYMGPVIRIYTSDGNAIYLKLESLGDFTGREWLSAVPYSELIRGELSAEYLPGLTDSSEQAYYSVQIDPLLPVRLNPYYLIQSANAEVQMDDTRANGAVSGIYTMDYVRMGMGTPGLNPQYQSYEAAYQAFVHDHYLAVDSDTGDYLKRIIQEQGFDADDPDIVQKVATYVQNAATYNLQYDSRMDEEANIAIAFLETYREGVCRHYATVATLIYRALGIPARYTVGFMAIPTPDEWTEVTGEFAHAWVEIYVPGVGWQMVEVTPASGQPGGPGSGSGGGDESGDGDESGGGDEEIIKPVKLEISLSADQYAYDGKSHTYNIQARMSGFDQWAAQGYTYEYSLSGVRAESQPGKYSVAFASVVIYNEAGEDVTKRFEIKKTGSYMQIYIAKLVLVSEDIARDYNSLPQVGDEDDYRIDEEASAARNGMTVAELHALLDQWGITLSVSGKPETDVGRRYAQIIFEAKDQTGKICTDYFVIEKNYGVFTIHAVPLVVVANSATIEYDFDAPDRVLSANGWQFGDADGLIAGDEGVGTLTYVMVNDRVEVVIEGQQIMPGYSTNKIVSVTVFNKENKDVTANYQLKYIHGTLTVTMPDF